MVHNSRAQTKKMPFCNCAAVHPGERSRRSCPTHKCLVQSKELREQLDRRQAFWAVPGERSTARQCRGYGTCPSRTAAGDKNTDSKLQQHPWPLENKIPPHKFSTLLAVEIAPASMRGFHIIMPITQGLPQRNELRVQPDGRRQAVWAVPRARSTARGALEHEYEVARQFSQSRRHNYEQHAQPVGPVRGFAWACMALRGRNASL